MNKLENNETSRAIEKAFRSKRESQTSTASEIAELEASLVADLETFDFDAAKKKAQLEHLTRVSASSAKQRAFPEIIANRPEKPANNPKTPPLATAATIATTTADTHSSLLAHLRQQATKQLQAEDSAQADRQASNQSINLVLKQLFSFLHELVQQLNIVKPEITRHYPLIDKIEFSGLNWQEGFADFRTQPQSDGALTELVSFSCQISTPGRVTINRDGLSAERFRALLFDYGLQFTCKEFHNERRFVERAEFEIQSKISISARWRADFPQGRIILETRNLERFGSMPYTLLPEQIDQALLDQFGRLLLGQPNRFRDLIRR